MPVVFKKFIIGLDLGPGCQDSLDLHESLSECSNENVFKTEFVKKLLNFKWE